MPGRSSFAMFTLNSTTRTARGFGTGGAPAPKNAPYIGQTLSAIPAAATAAMPQPRSASAMTSAMVSNIA